MSLVEPQTSEFAPSVAEAWRGTISRRLDEVLSGSVHLVDADETTAMLEADADEYQA